MKAGSRLADDELMEVTKMSRIEGALVAKTDHSGALKTPLAAPEAVTFHGLCSACALAAVCTFPRDPVRKIMHCEEFEPGLKPDIHLVPPPRQIAPHGAGAPALALGLCADCVHRDACTFQRPESGVWHCEEYS